MAPVLLLQSPASFAELRVWAKHPSSAWRSPLLYPQGWERPVEKGPHGELLVGGIWARPTERVGPLLEAAAGKVVSLTPAGPLQGVRKGRAVGPLASSKWGPGLGGDLWESPLAGRMGLSGLPWAAGLGLGGGIRVSSGVWDLGRLSCGWLVEWTGAGGLPAKAVGAVPSSLPPDSGQRARRHRAVEPHEWELWSAMAKAGLQGPIPRVNLGPKFLTEGLCCLRGLAAWVCGESSGVLLQSWFPRSSRGGKTQGTVGPWEGVGLSPCIDGVLKRPPSHTKDLEVLEVGTW